MTFALGRAAFAAVPRPPRKDHQSAIANAATPMSTFCENFTTTPAFIAASLMSEPAATTEPLVSSVPPSQALPTTSGMPNVRTIQGIATIIGTATMSTSEVT